MDSVNHINSTVLKFVGHMPCQDGFTALWAAHKRYGNKAQYFGETHNGYNTTNTLLNHPDIGKFIVVFLDICPKRSLLEALACKTKAIAVIDHHITSQEECDDLPYTYFDTTRSGAGLAWDLLCGTSRPFLIDLVEDRDLWKHEIPDSKLYNLWISTLSKDFDSWTRAEWELQNNPQAIKRIAQSYAQYEEHLIADVLNNSTIHYITLGNISLPAITSSMLKSDIGDKLCLLTKSACAIYHQSTKGWQFSLRSADKYEDVSIIAKQYGGGGHRNAAGFKLETIDSITSPNKVVTICKNQN